MTVIFKLVVLALILNDRFGIRSISVCRCWGWNRKALGTPPTGMRGISCLLGCFLADSKAGIGVLDIRCVCPVEIRICPFLPLSRLIIFDSLY